MSQIYATFIKVDDNVINYLGIKKTEHATTIINFYNLHILVTLTKHKTI